MRGAVRSVEEAIKSGDRKAAEAALKAAEPAHDARGAKRRHAQEDREPKSLSPEPRGRQARQVNLILQKFFLEARPKAGLLF